jgi:Na+-translocating ferredoxin:NAD+ oxidoreductase RnfC subunit
MQKLGLTKFRNVGPLRPEPLAADKVGIKLKQHLGAPCAAAVKVGQRVVRGEVVGRPPQQDGKPALGAPVHASIAGVVTAVADGIVWIEKQ